MQSNFIEQLQCRLVELGCPRAKLRRLAQEVAEHREDIKQAALAEGLAGAEAEARADARLGDPLDLAKHQMFMLRQSSWFGRHFFFSFCLLPLLTVPVLWGLVMSLDLAVGFALGYGGNEQRLHVASDNPVTFHHLVMAIHSADYIAMALVTLIFCWLARRSAVGLRWMLAACGICSLYAMFIMVHVKPHVFAVGIYDRPQWIRAVIPLLVASVICAHRRRNVQNFREKLTAGRALA